MLRQVPTERHLARAYYELSLLGAACVGEKASWPYKPKNREDLFCLAADMSRHDPRLFSILVRFLGEHWCDLNPRELRARYSAMATPQTIAVMAEFLLGVDALEDEAGYFFEYLKRGMKPMATSCGF